MDPAYEDLRELQPKISTSLRMPQALLARLSAIAEIERGSVGELLVEGAQRVREARTGDPVYLQRVVDYHDARIEAAQTLITYAASHGQ